MQSFFFQLVSSQHNGDQKIVSPVWTKHFWLTVGTGLIGFFYWRTTPDWGPSLTGLGCQCPAVSFAAVSHFSGCCRGCCLVVASLWLSKWRTGHAKVNTKCVNTMRHGDVSEYIHMYTYIYTGDITILLDSHADSQCWHCNYHCDTICCLA